MSVRVIEPIRAAALLLALALSACIREPEATLCPTGIYCPAGTTCAEGIAVCLVEGGTCGNGVVEAKNAEECDQGQNDTADCLGPADHEGFGCRVSVRGDGLVNAAAGEQCDGDDRGSGNGLNCQSATCNADCTPSRHGDGKANPLHRDAAAPAGEQCDRDDAAAAEGADCESPLCNANCTWSRHGDGIVNASALEDCDGGTGASPDCRSAACNPNCTASRHGDGLVNPLHVDAVTPAGEQCDGGVLGGASTSCESRTCTDRCTESRCGDGIPNASAGEECDAGAANSNAGACTLACEAAACGDGLVQAGVEACDLASLNGEEACPYGMTSCQGCTLACQLPATPPTPHYCGDGQRDGLQIVSPAEACDDARSFACGTCRPATDAAPCTIVTPFAAATGRITVVSTDLLDGDAIVLDDGASEVTFEVDTDGACTAGPARRCVAVDVDATPPSDTASAVAARIAAAVAAARTDGLLDIRSSAAAGATVVSLTHDLLGIVGNVPVVVARVGGAPINAIEADGMSGGIGCRRDDPCNADADCVDTDSSPGASGNCNRRKVCD